MYTLHYHIYFVIEHCWHIYYIFISNMHIYYAQDVPCARPYMRILPHIVFAACMFYQLFLFSISYYAKVLRSVWFYRLVLMHTHFLLANYIQYIPCIDYDMVPYISVHCMVTCYIQYNLDYTDTLGGRVYVFMRGCPEWPVNRPEFDSWYPRWNTEWFEAGRGR
jgi:hypothetical protein